MSEFQPITTVAILDLQDDDDIVEGYMAGYCGAPEPGSTKSRGFHHGWSNGRVDAGRAEMSIAQNAMASDWIENRVGRPLS